MPRRGLRAHRGPLWRLPKACVPPPRAPPPPATVARPKRSYGHEGRRSPSEVRSQKSEIGAAGSCQVGGNCCVSCLTAATRVEGDYHKKEEKLFATWPAGLV